MVIVGGGDGSLSSAVDELVDRDCVFALAAARHRQQLRAHARHPARPRRRDRDDRHRQAPPGRPRHDRRRLFRQQRRDGPVAAGRRDRAAQAQEAISAGSAICSGRAGAPDGFRPFHLTIEVDGERHEMDALEVRIANGGYHGGVEVVDAAEVDSGEIVVQAVTGRDKNRLVWNWLATLTRHRSRKRDGARFPRPPAQDRHRAAACRSRSTARCSATRRRRSRSPSRRSRWWCRPSRSRIEPPARLGIGLRLLDHFLDRRRRPHPRLPPAAVQIEGDRQRDIDERGDREAQPQGVGAEPGIERRARSRAGPGTGRWRG